ncbi:MAG: type II toxin-antitoxin system RelE/ParE family toxin [Methyloceanibacter sp.]|uniref:type II toxin-antitoxin system RelE/ParE family toxin n=1 Tax=Methyloceanibacter sp. TaxID=1965321 RepID=UPI003D6DA695
MRIGYSPRAVCDLIDIGDYLAERNPLGAIEIERRIRTVVDLIAAFPNSGRVVEERPSVRAFPLGVYPYLIFYTTTRDEVIILHIRHAAREPIDPSEL